MIKMTCDRCGRGLDPNAFNFMNGVFSDPKNESKWRPSMMVCGTDPMTAEYRRFELCEECEKDLYRFIFNDEVKEVEQINTITNRNPNT